MRAHLVGLTLLGACGFNVSGGSAIGDGGGGSDAVVDHDADLDSGGPLGGDASPDAMVAACPNRMHWEADFSTDPRMLDVNGDTMLDWVIRGAAPSSPLPGQLDSGVWRVPAGTVSLDSQPKIDFDGITRVHLRMRANADDALTDQWGSVFWLNAGYGDGHFAPIMISVTRIAGQQFARVLTKIPVTGTVVAISTLGPFGNDMLDLQLTVDATQHTTALLVNNSASATGFFVDQTSNVNDDRWATLTSWDVETEFDLIEIENCP